MTKAEAKKQVTHFAKSNGISVSGKDGIPLLVKGKWMYCADDWIDAFNYLKNARINHLDLCVPLPWVAYA